MSSLTISFFALISAIGLLVTVTPLKASLLGFGSLSIGLIGSAYFAGSFAGGIASPALIRRVGHIRAHAGLVALATIGALFMPLAEHPAVWAGIRALTGLAAAGLYVITEAWIVAAAPVDRRGQALARFQVVYYVGSAFGQQVLMLDEAVTWRTFSLAAALFAASIPPLCFAAISSPAVPEAPKLRLGWLYQVSPIGVVGTLMVGFSASAIWALMPVTTSALGYSPAEVSAIMTAIIIGCAGFQLPAGWISDQSDRRIVLLCTAVPAAILALVLWWTGKQSIISACILMGMLGGTVLVQYALSVLHANDRAGASNTVEVSSALLLLYCVGAVMGPILATGAVSQWGPSALFLFIAAINALFSAFIVYRLMKRPAVLNPVAGTEEATVE